MIYIITGWELAYSFIRISLLYIPLFGTKLSGYPNKDITPLFGKSFPYLVHNRLVIQIRDELSSQNE